MTLTAMKRLLFFLSLAVLLAGCGKSYDVTGNKVTVPCKDVVLRVQVISSYIVRVSALPDGKFTDRQSLAVVPQEPFKHFTVSEWVDVVRIKTDDLTVEINKERGTVRFLDIEGFPLAEEGRFSFTPIEVEGKKAWSVRTQFNAAEDESFYGLGQHQSGEFDHRGRSEELFQYNTKVSVPFVVSTRDYGLLFDAYSLSRWGNPSPYSQLGQELKLYDKEEREGALTGTYVTAGGHRTVRREDSLYFENEFTVKNLPDIPLAGARVTYEGWIEASQTADYHFIQYYAGFQQTRIGNETVMTRRWRPAWNPNSYKYTVHLEAGQRVPIRVDWEPDGGVSYFGLRVAPLQTPEEEAGISFWSEFEPQGDFYFIAGENYDRVIAGYRQLTGQAPVVPKWALGFWQSRERYSTQQELVETLAELRRMHIPVDNIVQDWQYWKDDQWGSHCFDETRYPDPEKMMDDVHAMHGRFMISVWPKFYTNTDNYKELKEAGYAYTHAEEVGLTDWLGHPESFYDAYAEGGREMFWRQMDENLYTKFGRKIDAWWMDASEPNLRDCLPLDYQKWLTTPTALGPSTEYLNAYALVNAMAIYDGQRSVDPDKRVFLLTRSGFAGLQRYSTATWSGDIGTSWTDMRMQMAAGLNYSMSGIPYWGMDIGGFSVMSRYYDPANIGEWRELQVRWHQFGAFVPLFRAHGQWPPRELYNIATPGTRSFNAILYYMKLRYNLMPYLYSMAARVTNEGYTIMRGLPMDYPDDLEVRDLSDQWMFGSALMPCPVYEPGVRSRSVYFPAGGWYDFYKGEYVEGGQWQTVPAPYERIPLYARAGSILPIGPDMEWCDEKAPSNVQLYIYAGADADFLLYEDDGVSFAYERGECATIPMHWDDKTRTLTIGERTGSFPGMLERRFFNVKVVDPEHPKPFSHDLTGENVFYIGDELTVKL